MSDFRPLLNRRGSVNSGVLHLTADIELLAGHVERWMADAHVMRRRTPAVVFDLMAVLGVAVAAARRLPGRGLRRVC